LPCSVPVLDPSAPVAVEVADAVRDDERDLGLAAYVVGEEDPSIVLTLRPVTNARKLQENSSER
jgi:hypothetical protein